jgi:hypothetical protein
VCTRCGVDASEAIAARNTSYRIATLSDGVANELRVAITYLQAKNATEDEIQNFRRWVGEVAQQHDHRLCDRIRAEAQERVASGEAGW